jgi:hypothetical protein
MDFSFGSLDPAAAVDWRVLPGSYRQKTMNIHVMLNLAELREKSRGLKKRDPARRSE